jgi:hypothetical protein
MKKLTAFLLISLKYYKINKLILKMFGKVQLSAAVLLLISKSEVRGLKIQKNIQWP